MSTPRASGKSFVSTSTQSVLLLQAEELNVGDAVVVNPDISSGIPIAGINRYPPPGSRPEQYATPATKGACGLSSVLTVADSHQLRTPLQTRIGNAMFVMPILSSL